MPGTAMPQFPLLTAYPPPRLLRQVLPLWAFGLEGAWLARHLALGLDQAASQNPRLAGLAASLAAWRFERQPLNPACLAPARAGARQAGASPCCRAWLHALVDRLRLPEAARDWPGLRDGPDQDAALARLSQGMADPAFGLFWRGKAFEYALARGLPELAEAAAAPLAGDPALAPLAARLAAEAAVAFAGPRDGLRAVKAVDADCFPRFAALAKAHCLLAAGEADQGLAELWALWRRENWHPGLTLRLHALVFPPPLADLDAWPGRIFVFLYSWNRSKLLARTLDSLAQSRLGPARVLVLDNGSSDDTARVCQAMAHRFAPGRFETVSLPVNIGAPAARNWLAAVSGLGPNDMAAYVDDDVTLPRNWLAALAGALAADPGAEAAGACIRDARGRLAQTADVRLLPPDDQSSVRPLVNCGPGPDFGLLGTHRPCPSVSGCCHLLRGSALAGPAPFDIRFSPSQFDDLARDLTAYLAGRRCVYVGTLDIAHHQHAGPGQARSAKAVGQLLGGRAKLDGLFAASDMAVAARRDADTAWDELEAKWVALTRLSPTNTGED